jgi:spermidine/putrescine transport system substrate-binding protein
MNAHLDRRRFNLLVGAGVAGAAAGLRPGRADAGKTITVLNWQGYGTDEAFALKNFQAATGIEVKHDYYNSEPEMITKLRTNPGAYDVALINSARDRQAQADGLIDPMDFSKVPNSKDLLPRLKNHANVNFDGKAWGVPWVWGMNALAVRKGKVTNVDSYAVLADPAYAGRVALFDDAVTEIGVAALLKGQDINNPKDLFILEDTMKSWKKEVKLLWSSEDEWNKAFAADAFDVSIYWSGAVARSQNVHKLPVTFVIPKEGAIGWLDNLCIPATSSKKDLGLTFINYMIDPKFYAEWATSLGAPASANSVAMAALPDSDLNKQIHKPEYLEKLQFMSALPDDRRQAFADAWEETKAFYAK